MIGSSKGGSCALLFGAMLNANACIIGAPQYHIGDYLNIPEHRNILKALVGEELPTQRILELNNLIHDTLMNSNRKTEIFLHYSKYENTYETEIVDLLKDLYALGFLVHLDNEYDYLFHAEVAQYYPAFLHSTCLELILNK